jgi:hypothetical protein
MCIERFKSYPFFAILLAITIGWTSIIALNWYSSELGIIGQSADEDLGQFAFKLL